MSDAWRAQRLARLVDRRVQRLSLDLRGMSLLTECATGPYAATALAGAAAGCAQVLAYGRDTAWGSLDEARAWTLEVAGLLGVADRITVLEGLQPGHLQAADIVTNSGHLRPLDAAKARHLRPGCVVPLMYEAWEVRPEDVDLRALAARGVPVVATNERHPEVDVFRFLGPMVVRALFEAGLEAMHNTVVLVCDNDFGPYIESSLRGIGAHVTRELAGPAPDAIVVATTPGGEPWHPAKANLAGTVVLQVFGDVDRPAVQAAGAVMLPPAEPPSGHMGVLPSSLGLDPIVRLQIASLKAAEVAHRALKSGASVAEAVRRSEESGYGQRLVDEAASGPGR